MEEQLQHILYNPDIGKILTLFFGFAIIWLIIKAIQRNVFSKIKDTDNRYRAKKFGSFIGYFLSIVLIYSFY